MYEKFHKFAENELVEVIPSKLNEWNNLLNHERNSFRVVGVSMNRLICCAGHPQSLVLDDGSHASGAWFDSNCAGIAMCPGTNPHRDMSYWRWE
jgi:hypothetical protein